MWKSLQSCFISGGTLCGSDPLDQQLKDLDAQSQLLSGLRRPEEKENSENPNNGILAV